MTTPVNADPELIRRLVIILVVIAVGLYLGIHVPGQPQLAMAALVLFALLFLLFARPMYVLLLLIFFLFEAFNLIDVDRFARLPGLFRAKDVLIFLAVGYAIANVSLHNPPAQSLRKSRLFKPMVAYILFLAFQMWRTKVLLGESPLLLFRQGRHFMTYALPLIAFYFLRRQRDWTSLNRFCVLFLVITTLLNIVGAIAGPLPGLAGFSADAARLGAFKSFNPAGSLAYWYLFRCLWSFSQAPNRKSLLQLLASGLAVMFYFHRGAIAGAFLGLALSSFAVPARVRLRAGTVFTLVAVVLVAFTIAGVAFSQTTSAGDAAASLKNYLFSTGTDLIRVEGTYASRVINDQQRYPLVKQHPLLGIGFLSVFGNVAYTMWKTQGVLPVGTIDTGWLDLMLRLGGIGTALLLWLLARGVTTSWRLCLMPAVDLKARSILLAGICTIIQAVSSSIAGGSLVWEPGITTIALCLMWTAKIEHDAAVAAAPAPAAEPAPPPRGPQIVRSPVIGA